MQALPGLRLLHHIAVASSVTFLFYCIFRSSVKEGTLKIFLKNRSTTFTSEESLRRLQRRPFLAKWAGGAGAQAGLGPPL